MTITPEKVRALLEAALRFSPAPWGRSNSGHQVFVAGPDGKAAPRTGMRPCGDPYPHVANVHRDEVSALIAACPDIARAYLEAVEGLRKYGRHGTNCASVCHEPGERRVPTGKPCTCGLDALLKGGES